MTRRRMRIDASKLCLAVAFLVAGCSNASTPDLETGRQLFLENRIEEALPLLERASAENPDDAETLTWLAETYRRSGRTENAKRTAHRALQLRPTNGFAHLVMAQALFPYGAEASAFDTVWTHVDLAVACDSTDGNAWVMLWAKAVFEQDRALFERLHRKLVETGFLTSAALAYGRWELATLPPNALLLTNGDMDTFPAEAVQVVEGFRPDVAVVERGLLNTPTGRRFIRDHLRVSMPFEVAALDSLDDTIDASGRRRTAADQILSAWADREARGAADRPIAFAPTVEEAFIEDYRDRLLDAGAFLLLQAEVGPVPAPIDTALARLSIALVHPDDFRGSWVSAADRSPVRRVYTKNLAKNITHTAIVYARRLTEARRFAEADRALTWATAFEQGTELGPVSADEIAQVRSRLSE